MRTEDGFGMGIVGAREGSFGEMYGDGWYEVARDRVERQREEAEEARLARWHFALAVVVERRETWRAVWERLGDRGRP